MTHRRACVEGTLEKSYDVKRCREMHQIDSQKYDRRKMRDSQGANWLSRPSMCNFLVLSVLNAVFSATAQAEWYVGAYGGLSYPGPFSNVTLSDPTLAGGVSGARTNDLELKSSL